jgi:hypothetical protein
MPTNTYVELRKETVGTATPSVTLDLTGISGYTDLVVVALAKNSVGDSDLCIRFNADTTTNYSATFMYGGGGAGVGLSARSSNINRMRIGRIDSTNAYPNIIHILDYANATTFKTVVSRSSNTGLVLANVGLWRKTPEAITSITFIDDNSANFAVGSTFALYGIKAYATETTAKASGGYIYEDSTYYYHTFLSSGTFTPSQSLSCDILEVAGGGGASRSGGGGAGGLRAFTSQSMTATGYTITVGAGGAGQDNPNKGTNGNTTSVAGSGFSTLAVSGGGGGGFKTETAGAGVAGGSGGGGGPDDNGDGGNAGGAGNAGSYSPVEGFAGGAGLHLTPVMIGGGGGGGAGGVGLTPTTTTSSNGGPGTNTYNSINFSTWLTATGTGVDGYLAGGGGGSYATSNNTALRGLGGIGGGGRGAGSSETNHTPGVANTGGGGGSGAWNGGVGAAGGSGLVIFRYLKA